MRTVLNIDQLIEKRERDSSSTPRTRFSCSNVQIVYGSVRPAAQLVCSLINAQSLDVNMFAHARSTRYRAELRGQTLGAAADWGQLEMRKQR